MPTKNKFDKTAFDSCSPDVTTSSPATPQQLVDEGIPLQKQTGGLASTPSIQPTVQRNTAYGEKVIYFGNAGIIMGPQRNTNEISGEARSGFPSDTIDIVVGFNDGGEPCNGQQVNVNSITDAARVYVSRSVKIDTMFGIARSARNGEGAEKPMSAVAMKADSVRIISRGGGIKLVTGRAQGVTGAGQKGERNSLGGDYRQSPTIDLIAGNNMGSHHLPFPYVMKPFINVATRLLPWFEPEQNYLQPALMGENTEVALAALIDIVSDLASAIMTTNTALTVGLSTLATNCATILRLQPSVAALGAITDVTRRYGMLSNWSIQNQMVAWEKNFLDSNATRYICSKNVNIT